MAGLFFSFPGAVLRQPDQVNKFQSFFDKSNNRDPAGRFSCGLSSIKEKEYGIKDTYEMSDEVKHMKEMIRRLKEQENEDQNNYSAVTEDKMDVLFAISDTEEEEEEVKRPYNYNYKEVSSKIQRAKNSVSAGRAVISAKRKVLEIKRKICASAGDPEELQLALSHARRMEIVAKKKKRHLELEELVDNVRKRDEKLEKMEETATDIKNSMIAVAEEEISQKEDAIFEEREEVLTETLESVRESGEEISDDMEAQLNEIISKLGEEELEALEEAMEILDVLEIIDPHMSEEDLKELKRKHRAEEAKAMLKADMDYLKGMIKHGQECRSDLRSDFSGKAGVIQSAMGSVGGTEVSSVGGVFSGSGVSCGMAVDIQL